MNKTMIAMVLLLALAGCSAPAPEAAPAASPAAETGAADESAPAAPASSPAAEVFSDLSGVFGMSGSFKCVYRMDNVEQVSQIKDGRMRSDAIVNDRESHTILIGEQIWVWTDVGCFTMNLAEAKNFPEAMAAEGRQRTQGKEEIAASAVDVNCVRANIPDSAFTPPSGCQDMGAMFKQMQNFQR